MLYFVVPRVPSESIARRFVSGNTNASADPAYPLFNLMSTGIAFNASTPLVAVPDASGMSTHYAPTNWSMTMDLALRGDNSGGYIPTYVTKMSAIVTEVTTSTKIGAGDLTDMTFPGKSKKSFAMPVEFAYASLNVSGDATFLAVYKACLHETSGTVRPNLNLAVEVTMHIRGLVGGKVTSTRLNTPCPFELEWE